MSASNLNDNISSDYLAAFNALLPESAAIRIFVYVESDEDISFWRTVLHEHETDVLEFEIQTLSQKGKTKAIEKAHDITGLQVGQYLIACVDSDYDYLLPANSAQATLLNSSPFLFQTYSYSFENLQCFSESLHAVCVQATKHDRKVVNFNELLKKYAAIVYDLLIWNLYFRSQNDHQTFTLTQLCDIVRLTDKVDVSDKYANALANLKTRVDAKITLLEEEHVLAINGKQQLSKDLDQKGLDHETAYMFIQGHTLKDNVVLMLLIVERKNRNHKTTAHRESATQHQ